MWDGKLDKQLSLVTSCVKPCFMSILRLMQLPVQAKSRWCFKQSCLTVSLRFVFREAVDLKHKTYLYSGATMARNDVESRRKQLLARLTSLKQHFSRKSDIYFRAVWTVLLLPLSVLQQHMIQTFLHFIPSTFNYSLVVHQ